MCVGAGHQALVPSAEAGGGVPVLLQPTRSGVEGRSRIVRVEVETTERPGRGPFRPNSLLAKPACHRDVRLRRPRTTTTDLNERPPREPRLQHPTQNPSPRTDGALPQPIKHTHGAPTNEPTRAGTGESTTNGPLPSLRLPVLAAGDAEEFREYRDHGVEGCGSGRATRFGGRGEVVGRDEGEEKGLRKRCH